MTTKKFPQRWLHAQADETKSPTYEVYCMVNGEEVLAHIVTTDQSKKEVKKMVSGHGFEVSNINIHTTDEITKVPQ